MALTASEAIVQVVVVDGTPQLNVGPPVWLNETNVICDGGVPAGSVSLHETVWAAFGSYGTIPKVFSADP